MTSQNLEEITGPKTKQITNFIDAGEINILINKMCDPAFPWAMTANAVTGVSNNIELTDDSIVGFFHTFVFDGQVTSPFFDEYKWILPKFESIGLDPNNLFRMRAGLFTKHPSTTAHEPHVDAEFPHTTAVLYIKGDGDFYLYNETYITHPFKKPEEFTIADIAPPGAGTLTVFNGKHYHASSYPNNESIRLAITFNFVDDLM